MTEFSTERGLNRVGNENPLLQIIAVKLDGGNYLAWSSSSLLAIQSCGLSNYLTGEVKKP